MNRNKASERARTSASPVAGRTNHILKKAVGAERPLIPDEVHAEIQQLGLSTPREAAAMIREDRDTR
jgi:hypothetical protein